MNDKRIDVVVDEFWTCCASQLSQEIPPQQFKLWIKPLVAISYDANTNTIKIAAPNRFKLDWVSNNYAGRICELAHQFFEKPIHITWEVHNTKANSKDNIITSNEPLANKISNFDHSQNRIHQNPDQQNNTKNILFEDSKTLKNRTDINYEKSKLNHELCFDNFVSGKANQLARAAAEQVAANPGLSYNPLFLYGGVGLGKTHLIHSIGNKVLKNKPNAQIRYIHAEQYVSDVVKAYQRKAFEEFKKYYHGLDLLLIDDIQFFAGKSRTQEEFFYAFEQLISAKHQIIITSDTYPKDIQGIEERLISRFNCGLTVAIEPPELEMRVAILLKKADQQLIDLNEEIAFFIAKNMKSNIRELEGAFRRVIAFSSFHNKKITMELVKEALKDIISIHHGLVTVDAIQKTVADYYKIKVSDMFSKRRQANIVLPRQIAMYLTKDLTEKSYVEIGELFGGRDHTTVLHAVNKINDLRIHNTDINHSIHVLEQSLKG